MTLKQIYVYQKSAEFFSASDIRIHQLEECIKPRLYKHLVYGLLTKIYQVSGGTTKLKAKNLVYEPEMPLVTACRLHVPKKLGAWFTQGPHTEHW